MGEISAGLITGCMPTIPSFFRHLFPKRNDMIILQPTRTSKFPGASTLRAKMLSSLLNKKNHGRLTEEDDPYLLRNVYIEINGPSAKARQLAGPINATEITVSASEPANDGAHNSADIAVSKTFDVESQPCAAGAAIPSPQLAYLGQ